VDVAYVDSFVRETWWNGGAFFFCITQKYRKFLNSRHGDVSSIVPSQKGLILTSEMITLHTAREPTFPLRSRKKTAEAMMTVEEGGLVTEIISQAGRCDLLRGSETFVKDEDCMRSRY
jgi:hypothetical protein